jgi:predicted nucleic acid-binding protein
MMRVVDANVALWAVLPWLGAIDTRPQFASWARDDRRLVAPSLWVAEVTSGIRRAVHAGRLSDVEARLAVDDAMALGVELLPMTGSQARAALGWAARLGQSRAYDGFYVALAEELEVELWTVDQRLANAARREGLHWVHAVV